MLLLLGFIISPSSSHQIAAFYHIGVDIENEKNHIEIIDEQINFMNSSGLLSRVEHVYYGVVSNQYKRKLSSQPNFTFDPSLYGKKFVNIGNWASAYSFETKTLSKLHGFCIANPSSKVMYFHTKGVFHKRKSNEKMRQMLNVFILNTACMDALEEGYDICGLRLSPVPFVHYSGNFWWANCRYISKLVDPILMQVGSVLHTSVLDRVLLYYKRQPYYNNKNSVIRIRNNHGLHRFFSEAWVGSAPYVTGADCLPAYVAPNYLYGYRATDPISHYVQEILSGSRTLYCTAAATNISAVKFRKPFQAALKKEPCMDIKMVSYRTSLLYNDMPHSLIDWRGRLGE